MNHRLLAGVLFGCLGAAACCAAESEPGIVVLSRDGTTITEKLKIVGDIAEAAALTPINTSASITRNGRVIPLRPELLPDTPPNLTVPSVERTTLSLGIRYFAFVSHELPVVNFTIYVKSGSILDPANRVGLADVMCDAWRAGGTKQLSPEEFDRKLEDIGSELSVSAEREFTKIELFALTQHQDEALSLLAQLFTSPRFDEKKFEKQKKLKIEEIRRENDEPGDIARREFRKLIYGPDHPLARTPTIESVRAMKRDEAIKFYNQTFSPAAIWFGVSGDVDSSKTQESLKKLFAGWNSAVSPAAYAIPPANFAPATTVSLVRKDTAQSQIRLGHLGIPRHLPEEFAVDVLNQLYGSGDFSARLMSQVRTKLGYMYGVSGSLSEDDPLGVFYAAGSSKAASTAASVHAILDVTRGLFSNEFTDDEIETAKRGAIFAHLDNFKTPAEIVNEYIWYDFYGYAPDYLQRYAERIRAVSREQMLEVVHKHVHPEKLRLLLVGKESTFDSPASTLGQVTEIKLKTAPAEKSEKKK